MSHPRSPSPQYITPKNRNGYTLNNGLPTPASSVDYGRSSMDFNATTPAPSRLQQPIASMPSPSPQFANRSSRSSVSSPAPQDVVMYNTQLRGLVQSPEQIQPIYPTSISSQSTLDMNDPAVQLQFRMWQEQQQRQQQPAPPTQMPLAQRHVPQGNMPRDSGYGTQDSYNDRAYGQNYGSYQQMPPQAQPLGNRYGKIRAKGNAKVLMANVVDKNTNPWMVRQQQYEDAEFDGNADAMLDDCDRETMQAFFARPAQRR